MEKQIKKELDTELIFIWPSMKQATWSRALTKSKRKMIYGSKAVSLNRF